MNVALVGFGKMGKKIYQVASEKNYKVTSIIDPISNDSLVTGKELTAKSIGGCDVVIDFSHPSCIMENLKFYISNEIPAVIGTTGWYDQVESLKEYAIDFAQSSIIYSGNFSIGVSLYREVIKLASSLFGKTGSYDVFANEIHHREKADSPSGTAALISDIIIDNFDGKNEVVTNRLDRKISSNEIHVSSTRGGWIPGTHTVVFDSPFDSVEITHRARTRDGFALGAVLAADWLMNKKGFFTLDDFIGTLINSKLK